MADPVGDRSIPPVQQQDISIEAYPPVLLSSNPSFSNDEAKPTTIVDTPQHDDFVWDPMEEDILSGRGAKVNSRLGNKKFRALCFSRKNEFDVGTHQVKRRVATEIVYTCKQVNQSRFLKRTSDDGPWLEMTMEASIAKACQVMRDHQRPDREAIRAAATAQSGRKRERRVESTPTLEEFPMMEPVMTFVENPSGILENDVLSGRGAFVNGHMGNQVLRKMALERKAAFDAGNFTEKQALASEIVAHIRSLDPPGRFMKRTTKGSEGGGLSGEWEELSDDKAIHKACQVMRDINRPDRLDRKAKKKGKSWSLDVGNPAMAAEMIAEETAAEALKHANGEVLMEDVLQEAKRELPPLEDTIDESETSVVVAAAGLESVIV